MATTQIKDGYNGGSDNQLKVNSDGSINVGSATISGPVTATQGTSPWVDNVSQFGGNNVVTGTGASGLGIPRVTVSSDSNILATQSGTWNINNISGTISLPTGAATNSELITINSTLGSPMQNSGGSVTALQGTSPWLTSRNWNLSSGTDSVAAVQSGTWTVQQGSAPWSVSQSGAWTTGRTWNLLDTTDSVNVGNFPTTQAVTQSTSPWVVSGTVTSNQGTAAALSGAWPVEITDGANVLGTSAHPLRVDPTGTTTQPVSGTVTANQGGAPWSVSQSGTWTVQPGNTPNTSPWLMTISQGGNSAAVTASNALKVDGSAVTQPVSGTVTANQGTSPWVSNVSQFGGNNVVTGTGASGVGIPRVTVSNDSNVLATQSGTWTTGRTWTLGSGTDSVSAVQSGTWTVQQGTPPWITKDQADGPVTPGTVASFSQLAGGQYNTTAPAPITGQQVALQVNQNGALSVSQRNKYRNITGTGTTVIKSGSGVLNAIIIGNATSGGTLTLYDNTAGSGTIITTLTMPTGATNPVPAALSSLGIEFSTGLTAVAATSAANNFTLVYQ